MKYITSTGQNTGKSKDGKNVQKKAIPVAIVMFFHNPNSPNFLKNGLNSSVSLIGRTGLSNSSSSKSALIGVRKRKNRLRIKIAKQ